MSETLTVLVASFPDEKQAGKALATIAPALGKDNLKQAAVVVRTDDGKVRFVETHDKTTGQGALLGGGFGALAGMIGVLFGPVGLLGAPIGAAVGALVGKMKDSGYDDDELKALGADLGNGASALIATVAQGESEKAQRLIAELTPERIVVRDVEADLSAALDAEVAAA